jgi:hypothetical protein
MCQRKDGEEVHIFHEEPVRMVLLETICWPDGPCVKVTDCEFLGIEPHPNGPDDVPMIVVAMPRFEGDTDKVKLWFADDFQTHRQFGLILPGYAPAPL